jgi:hypothetical protein
VEDFQVYFEEADVVDLCFLLHVSCECASLFELLELTVLQFPRPSTLLDRLYGPLAAVRGLFHRTGQYPTNFHRPPSCPLVVAGNNTGRLPELTRTLDFPSIFRLLRRHRPIHLGLKFAAFYFGGFSGMASPILYSWVNRTLADNYGERGLIISSMMTFGFCTQIWIPLFTFPTVQAPRFPNGYPVSHS